MFILNTFFEALGYYLSDLITMSFRTAAFSDGKWLSSWTIFYWAWWVSWAPFVGVFIARISKGRTVREFVTGVLLIPSGVTFIWFTVMGGAALYSELMGAGGLVEAVNDKGAAISLFSLLAQYPATSLTSFVAIFLVAIFFVSGADAASVVMGMLSSHGSLDPGRRTLWCSGGFWRALQPLCLLVMGGLQGLQTASIIAAAPFLLVMVGLCVSLWRALLDELETRPMRTGAAQQA